MAKPKPTYTEIEALMDKALSNPGKFSGMTYAEGVEYTCRWVLGLTSDVPMDD